ncbi:hypothetical protein F4806DRAFT_37647 [Annulohypoxylon nitens]|nr:hypothetical protein F4806DRAFT_37647 [Annulohypoxylon nitens]
MFGFTVLVPTLLAVSSSLASPFSNDLCPSWYLRKGIYDVRQGAVWELVATCSIGDGNSLEWVTSSLNIDPCFTNHNGVLEPAVSGSSDEPGRFTRTCDGCGLDLEGPDGDDKKDWHVAMHCACVKNPINFTTIKLEYGVNVTDGILSCMKYMGTKVDYSPTLNPPMLPPPGVTTSIRTLTTTATINNNATSIATITATANNTIFNTATDTALTTVVSSCPSPSQVTITKTHKGKAHKVTKTTTVVQTHPVTVLVSIMVTKTPTPTPTIAAQLHSTVVADFTTING